jgi:heme-degrading monooxygenase HmoA
MIIRLVQMHFRDDSVEEFLTLFNERKALIRGFQGCSHLELWEDTHNKNTFFTYSIWESEDYLNHYRFSELFKDTWSKTKTLFKAKAEAFSVRQMVIA